MLVGTLNGEIDIKPAGNSSVLGKLNICTKRSYTNFKTKQLEVESSYLTIDCWGQVAESCRGFNVGDTVEIEGRLKINNWVDKTSGQEKKMLVVVADSVNLLSERKEISDSMRNKMQILDELPF